MEAKLKEELGTTLLRSTGYSGAGCISEGTSYDTDSGRVFVKINNRSDVCFSSFLSSKLLIFYVC